MTISNAELEYETHIGSFRNSGFLTGDLQRDSYWNYQAQKLHISCVIDAIGKIQSEVVVIGQKLEMGGSYHHLVFGVARRAKMIWGAIRQLNGLIAPDRTEPLPHDDVFEAARALNDIYIHTRGVLDNYAWAISYLFGGEEVKRLSRNQIDLFHRRYRASPSLSNFGEITEPYKIWQAELKKMRDPVAHRIPLTVPPALLDKDDQKIHAEMTESYQKSFRKFFKMAESSTPRSEFDAAVAEVDAFHEQLQKIGKFQPMIIHDPNEGGVPIYPTVPEDVGMLVKLARALNNKINEMIST